METAGVVIGVAVAGALALAVEFVLSTPIATAAPKAAAKIAAKKPAASRAKGMPASPALLNTYAAMPEAERLAIKSDLAWLGDYGSDGGGDFDGRTIDAIRTFQKRHGGKETGILTAAERNLLAAAAKASAAFVGWRLIDDPTTGAHLGLPEKLVPQSGASLIGTRWTSAQGQIQIETFRLAEASLPALFEDEKKRSQRTVAASVIKPDSFVISGAQGLKNFVVRAAAKGTEIRGIRVLYDQATKGIMDPIAVAVANSFAGFPDPNAASLPGIRRTVEYGTAIVVSSGGDLVAPAQLTDECRVITVPGLGNAERVAEDESNSLALLRLYGARDLVPAMLASDSAESRQGDELTLVGIADPFAQAGVGAVTRAAGHRTAHGVEPVPKLGFSGAAAIDARGRVVGIVDFKHVVVTDADATSQEAALVPVQVIDAFLQARGITPVASASGDPTIEQSVVRLICVRK